MLRIGSTRCRCRQIRYASPEKGDDAARQRHVGARGCRVADVCPSMGDPESTPDADGLMRKEGEAGKLARS